MNVRLKNTQNLRTCEELSFWILHKIMKIVFFFSANVHQWNIAFSAAHKQVCFRFFHLLYFFLADQDIAANSTWRICAFEWFLQLHTPNTNDYVLEAF